MIEQGYTMNASARNEYLLNVALRHLEAMKALRNKKEHELYQAQDALNQAHAEVEAARLALTLPQTKG